MAQSIIIPQKFLKHLKDDNNKWRRRVESLQELLSPILSSSPAFFPEYTDHGILHINNVLDFAANLIQGKTISKNAMNSRDVACLIAAILIHDLGMFLTLSGITMLIEPEWDSNRITSLDDKSWQIVWHEYVASAKLLPNAQKLRTFGKVLRVENTYLGKDPLIRDDILVIGEFLRRNHPRLAHEIAVGGFPGSQLQHLLQDAGFDEDERNAIGLIARSHGMALRDLEGYVGTGAYYSNIPIYYLMSLLRIADLLDASEDRAPMVRLKQEDLDSPLSQDEWVLNQRFKIDSSRWFEDTRNYVITAAPKTSSEYVRVEKWLSGAQAELDLCWSILAQKYPNSKLKLSIHRILCTMHEPANQDAINEKILPRELKVTASPEIVKLMIAPLYGNDPTYGVRELLQNAVDACLERQRWENEHDNPDYKGLVDIRIDGNTFTITDNGMGMNEDILLNYYLTAGASYRGSEQWKAANAPDGKSQVSRTGRFGVGFLAAFLLGDSIEVHTQHYSYTKGLHFSFDQRSMPLDVERQKRSNPYVSGDSIGTTIIIQMTDTVREALVSNKSLKWHNWYAFDEPKVVYHLDGEPICYDSLSLFRDSTRNKGWFSLPTDDYDSYQWLPNTNTSSPVFYCNGIRIYEGPRQHFEFWGLDAYTPHIAVTDNDACLDVDLSRRKLQSIPHEAALCRKVLRYYIARLLLVPWDSEETYRRNLELGFALRHNSFWGNTPFLLSAGGYQLNHASIIATLSIGESVLLYAKRRNAQNAVQTVLNYSLQSVPFSIAIKGYHMESPSSFLTNFLSSDTRLFDSNAVDFRINHYSSSIWLRNDVLQDMPKYRRSDLTLLKASPADRICTARLGNSHCDMPLHRESFPIDTFPVVIHVKLNPDDPNIRRYGDSLFAQTLKETLVPAEGYDPNDLWIPFDMEERKKKFRKAFDELVHYMEHIRAEEMRNTPEF